MTENNDSKHFKSRKRKPNYNETPYGNWTRPDQDIPHDHPAYHGKRIQPVDNSSSHTINLEDLTHIMDNIEFEKYLCSKEAEFDDNVYNIVDDMAWLLIKKQADYGPYNIASAPGGAMNGLIVRMHDKLARIINLTKSNKEPQNESLRDSFMDLANYCVIAIMVLNNQWEGAKYPEGDCE